MKRAGSLTIHVVAEGCPSIRAKALSRTKISFAVPSTAFFAREVEDQDSGNLTLNNIPPYAGCESAQSRLRSSSRRPGVDLRPSFRTYLSMISGGGMEGHLNTFPTLV